MTNNPLPLIVAIFMIALFGGKLFLEELKTWKFIKTDRPKRKPAAIILIVNALLIIKPP